MRECPKCGTCYGEETLQCQFHEAETKSVLPGPQTLAGRYKLERRLGRGAMGQVYLARDENLGTRQVAVKTVRPDLLTNEDLQEGEAIARFEREARAAASIRHPNVVDVTDFGKSAEGVFYLVMEYVKGETLHDLLRREGTLTTKRALALLTQIGAGVEAAHESGILHRDLKPANIFLLKTSKRNDDGFIKVGDFGLAKIVSDAQSEVSQKQGPASRGIIGTPEFMAPEQMHSEFPIDGRADIYALGTIAYMMLGGRVPFSGDLMQIVTAKMTQQPPPLSRLRSDISPPTETAIMHALKHAAKERPENVSAWLDELSTAVENENVKSAPSTDTGRLVVLAPVGAEVYVDDERKGSIGSSGKIILSSITPGRHVLRVSQIGARDDERLIEVREDSGEQVIQAVLKSEKAADVTPGRSGETSSRRHESVPDVVLCTKCSARFAAGVKFCGRCGNAQFKLLPTEGNAQDQTHSELAKNNLIDQQRESRSVHRITIDASQQTANFSCPRCARSLPPNAKFCGGCGLNLPGGGQSVQSQQSVNFWNQNNAASRPVEVVCRRCGATYSAGTRFCGKCGNTI